MKNHEMRRVTGRGTDSSGGQSTLPNNITALKASVRREGYSTKAAAEREPPSQENL
jgi:hypothetical protein